MVILGLGSNLGDRLSYLRHALNLIKKIPHCSIKQVSPVYLSDALVPENAPSGWSRPYLNLALRCETTLTPYELLAQTKQIEILVGRQPEKNWGPRIVDIDLLAWDDLIQYDEKLHIPHENLHERPFALWPLADVAPHWIYPLAGPDQGKTAAEIVLKWGSRFDGNAPFHTRQIQQRIDTPRLVGILNLTPDSFSGDGKFSDITRAVQHAISLVNDGAEVIDIGAEATGPNATSISTEIEWQRLEPILDAIIPALATMSINPKISIDTRHTQVAQKALDKKVDWINDVSGLEDPAMQEIIASNHCDVVIMHHLGIPVKKNQIISHHQNIVELLLQWGEERINLLEKNNIKKDRIIFDVGIGYGKTQEQSLELIKNIHCFHQLNTRLLVGHSRKSFLQQFTNKPALERDLETTILSLCLAKQSVDYLRVHNTYLHAQAFKVAAST